MSSYSFEPTAVNDNTVQMKWGKDSDYELEDDIEIDIEDDGDISDSTDTDAEDYDQTDERHEDHWDRVYFRNPWAHEWTSDFVSNWVERKGKSLTNEELYQNAITQKWMKAFSSMRRNRISLLTRPRGSDRCTIPLFQDDNGWQYQVRLTLCNIPLPKISCPSILPGNRISSSSLFELKRRIQVEPNSTAKNGLTPPKRAVLLGKLKIRSNARRIGPPGDYVTEATDYSVIVDVEHEDMPLWIVAARPQLQKRLNNKYYPKPIKNLSIFDGLLEKEDDCGYDCACILSSLRHLGKPPSDPDAPSFQDTCELIRKTRAIVDPVAIRLPQESIKDFIGDEPLYDSFESIPYSELGSQQEETKVEEKMKVGDETKNREETTEESASVKMIRRMTL